MYSPYFHFSHSLQHTAHLALVNMSIMHDDNRIANLRDAQTKAEALFRHIERRIIRAGISEKVLSREVYDFGEREFGIKKYWHKRIVRSGPNTLLPYADSPPDRIIQEDDILIVDLGPVFESYEADFARTFVLGNDPLKIKLRDDLEPIWNKVREYFLENIHISGEQLYTVAVREATRRGWEFGAPLAGHLIGNFPHERIPKDQINLYITKGNHRPMNSLGADGHKRHWILEIYLHDHEHKIGGFFEQLLTDDDRYIFSELPSVNVRQLNALSVVYHAGLLILCLAVILLAVYMSKVLNGKISVLY